MTLSGETRITKRVEKLMIDPFYAILFGFVPADYLGTHPDANPDDIPTDTLPGGRDLYDFMDRLIRRDGMLHRSNIHKRRRKPKSKLKKNQKYNSSSSGVVEHLVNRVIKYLNLCLILLNLPSTKSLKMFLLYPLLLWASLVITLLNLTGYFQGLL